MYDRKNQQNGFQSKNAKCFIMKRLQYIISQIKEEKILERNRYMPY